MTIQSTHSAMSMQQVADPVLAGWIFARYSASVAHDWRQVETRWEALAQDGAALPFQRCGWLRAWYDTLGREAGVEPMLVTIRDEILDRDVVALPLVKRLSRGLRIVSFADRGLTDYNAPILGAGAPTTVSGARNLIAALRKAVEPADILDLEKMPAEIGGRPNPLLLVDVQDSRLFGNVLHVPGQWDAWHWGLERTFRKELERSWRVFSRHDGADFRQIVDREEAVRIFAELKRLQSERIRDMGLPYVLDEPAVDSFYDKVLEDGLARGSAVLTALVVKDEVVAALLGVTDGKHYAMVRLATAGDAWKNCSPGRLVIERTMKMLHAEGYRSFDFTIGDYAYKRRLGVESVPLYELRMNLSCRGLPLIAMDRLKRRLRADPLAMACVAWGRDMQAKLIRRRAAAAAAS